MGYTNILELYCSLLVIPLMLNDIHSVIALAILFNVVFRAIKTIFSISSEPLLLVFIIPEPVRHVL